MLRLATIEDAETIATIHVRTWQSANEGIIPAQYLDSLSIQERATLWRRVISEQRDTVFLAICSAQRSRLYFFWAESRQRREGKGRNIRYLCFAGILERGHRTRTFGGSRAEDKR